MESTIADEQRATIRSGHSERLETRLSSEDKALVQRAADLEHRKVTDFVRSSLRHAAEDTIRRHESMTLSAEDAAAFVEELMNPTVPNDHLRAAAKAHRDLIGE